MTPLILNTAGALAAALTLAPALWLIVRGLNGEAAAPLSMLLACMVFALPVGAVWTHYFCQNPKRMIVATLSGIFFGIIHIDSYGLVLVTTGLGIVLAWLFMEDRTRNLAALGLIHGFLGSTFGKLFKGDAAGPLHVDYRVGPWNVEEPTAAVLIVPTICIALTAGLLGWTWKRLGPLTAGLSQQPR